MEAKRAATGEGSLNAFSRVGGQAVAGTPFVVLSGNLQPGQSSDPASGFSTVEKRVSLEVLYTLNPAHFRIIIISHDLQFFSLCVPISAKL